MCKRMAEMVVRASSPVLRVILHKTRNAVLANGTAEFRLKSGDVDADEEAKVVWGATSEPPWLQLDESRGSVFSNEPVAAVVVIANGTGLNDTAEGGPLAGKVTFKSSSRIMTSSNFVGGSNSLTLGVELTILASAYVDSSDVTIGIITSNTSRAFVPRQALLTSGDALVVCVDARDHERLPIRRAGQEIVLSVIDSRRQPRAATMLHVAGNTYRGEIPASWIGRPGRYTLSVASIADGVGLADQVEFWFDVHCAPKQEVGGECLHVSLCDRVNGSFSLADDNARGARVLALATLTLPAGVVAKVSATPLQSTVLIPVRTDSGSETGGLEAEEWTGSASLAYTGDWTIQVAIGSEQCAPHSLRASCMAGFLEDGRGGCFCPPPMQNGEGVCKGMGVDPCQLVTLSENGATFRQGARVSVAIIGDETAYQYQTELIPVDSTEIRDIAEGIWFNRTGEFQLNLKYGSADRGGVRQCNLKPIVTVACGKDEQEIDGHCRPLEACRTSDGFWEDSDLDAGATTCKRRPRMVVKSASSKLAIVHRKSWSTPRSSALIEIRLESGDVDAPSVVSWNASSSSAMLVLEPMSGVVSSASPVAVMTVVIVGYGQNDTVIAGPLRSAIIIESSIRGRSDLFENATNHLRVPVEETIEAAVNLTSADVRMQKSSGLLVLDGEQIVAGDTLLVTADAFDYERLPIARAGLQIPVQLVAQSGQGRVP
jgi:hypothetical protein